MNEFFKRIFRKKEIQKELQEFNKDVISIGNDFISSSVMLVDKKISGGFYCLDEFIIDTDANITGSITAARCVIKGRINGSILSPGKITIKSTAIVEGEITAATAEIESGACINGCIKLQRGLQVLELAKKVKEGYQDNNRQQVSNFKLSSAPVQPVPVQEEKKPVLKEPVIADADTGSGKDEKPAPNNIPESTGSWW